MWFGNKIQEMLYHENLMLNQITNLEWILDVIRSCETLDQLDNSKRLFLSYEKQVPQVPPFITSVGRIRLFIEHRKRHLKYIQIFNKVNPKTCN
jgi:hypothetical protein